LNAREAALVVVDLQEKLVNMIHDKEKVIGNSSLIIELAKIYQIPILLTEHYPQGLGYTVDEIKACLPSYEPVYKRIFSCFGVKEFRDDLVRLERKQLMVLGIETHICVDQTVHDALVRGYQVHVISDACGTRNPWDHAVGLEKMRTAGAIVSTAEMAAYEIAERADTEEFKRVLQLVK
jgi:nicotinamidase-related amidase